MLLTKALGRQQFNDNSDTAVRRSAVLLERQRAFMHLFVSLN
jgi:hypothetical protein